MSTKRTWWLLIRGILYGILAVLILATCLLLLTFNGSCGLFHSVPCTLAEYFYIDTPAAKGSTYLLHLLFATIGYWYLSLMVICSSVYLSFVFEKK